MMPNIEAIKDATGSWEKTARRFYELINVIAQDHPETEALIQDLLHTEIPPKKMRGRKSFVFKGQVKSGKTGLGWADIALIIRNSGIDGIKNNQEAAEYIWSRLVQYGMHDQVTPEEESRIIRKLAQYISDADPEKKKGNPRH